MKVEDVSIRLTEEEVYDELHSLEKLLKRRNQNEN